MCARPPKLKGFFPYEDTFPHTRNLPRWLCFSLVFTPFKFGLVLHRGHKNSAVCKWRRAVPRSACVSGWRPPASHRTASYGMTQIHSLSVGGTFSPRMSSRLLGAKNKWLSCDALARIFVCYCVLFYWGMWRRGWGARQTVFEHNYPFKLTSFFWHLKGKSRLPAGC